MSAVLKRLVMLRQLAVWLSAVIADISADKPGPEDIRPSQEMPPSIADGGEPSLEPERRLAAPQNVTVTAVE